MTNSDLFSATLSILEGQADIPKQVSSSMLMAAMRHIAETVKEVRDCIPPLDKRIEELENKERTRADTDALREERRVTFPWILEKFGVPFVMTIVAILTTLVITGYFN